MAPKAAHGKAKLAATPKAPRKYRTRGAGMRVAPPSMVTVNTKRQAAQRLRPGRLVKCPYCTYPRYIPDGVVSSYRCAMPRVRLVDGDYFTCGFTTTAAAWRGRPGASLAYETACKAVVHHVVRTVAAKCDSGEVDDGDFFPEVRRIMAAEAALKQEAATQVLPVVKKEAPKSRAAMRQAILKMEPQDDVARI